MYDSVTSQWPRTIEDAVDRVIAIMSEEEKYVLMNSPEKELINFHFGLGNMICEYSGESVPPIPGESVPLIPRQNVPLVPRQSVPPF